MPSGREPIDACPNGRVKEDPVLEELESVLFLSGFGGTFCFVKSWVNFSYINGI